MRYRTKSLAFTLLFSLFLLPLLSQINTIEKTISIMLEQEDNYFFIDVEHYPKMMNELPIGIFDSGTGGLTVFNSIITMDLFNNENHNKGTDGVNDFSGEQFIYLGDLANMPYGNYHHRKPA